MLRKIRKMLKGQKGFTLVELMAVVAIIGILAAIAVPKFASATLNAQAAKVAADLRSLETAITMHQIDRGTDPTDIPALETAGMLQAAPTSGWGVTYSIVAATAVGVTPAVPCHAQAEKNSFRATIATPIADIKTNFK